MDEVLKQILSELKDIKSTQNKTNEKIDNIESDISIIKTQVKEHNQILSSVQKASEFHKADIDNLTHQVAQLSGDVKSNHSELTEVVQSLVEMYGHHEVDIRALKRKPV
jgi:uncharacterized coiled-coil DUF342 family protein